ncbi:MAG: hypothetical protein U0P30_09985 [Vicinamibacterales bacterium]
MFRLVIARRGLRATLATIVVAVATSAFAQSAPSASVDAQPAPPVPPPAPRITVTSGLDATSSYMFRGIYQEDHGLVAPAFLDVRVPLYRGDGRVSALRANVGTWDSFHSGPTGAAGHGSAWYEADYYASMTATLGRWSPGVIATAITSPNSAFGTVYEVGATLEFDDSAHRLPLAPRAFFVAEVSGQADAGTIPGRYLELSVRPTHTLRRMGRATWGVALPARAGFSVRGYYESPESSTLGFASAGAVPSVTITGAHVALELHAGLEFMRLGSSASVFNSGRHNRPIVTAGASLTY